MSAGCASTGPANVFLKKCSIHSWPHRLFIKLEWAMEKAPFLSRVECHAICGWIFKKIQKENPLNFDEFFNEELILKNERKHHELENKFDWFCNGRIIYSLCK